MYKPEYKNVGEFFDRQAKKYNDKTYLIFDKTEKEFSYKIKGFKKYKSEIEEFPNPKSIK